MKLVVLIFLLSIGIGMHAAGVHSDQQAYAYCTNNTSAFIAIIWPQAQGKDSAIEKLFKQYGTIVYKKQVYFTYEQASALLKDAHPHITDMKSHMHLYFPSGTLAKPARVYVLNFKSLDTAVQCKHAIRALFNLGYTSIHINDYHHELLKLAQFFFNGGGSRYSEARESDQRSCSSARIIGLCLLRCAMS